MSRRITKVYKDSIDDHEVYVRLGDNDTGYPCSGPVFNVFLSEVHFEARELLSV